MGTSGETGGILFLMLERFFRMMPAQRKDIGPCPPDCDGKDIGPCPSVWHTNPARRPRLTGRVERRTSHYEGRAEWSDGPQGRITSVAC